MIFLTPYGIKEVRGNQVKVRSCYFASMREAIIVEAVVPSKSPLEIGQQEISTLSPKGQG
ncbi:hypothetical protein LguiB_032313 [Lonicera macranthoides]